MDMISESDKDNESLVLRARCIKPELPNKDRVYAMKFLSDYMHGNTQTQVRSNNNNTVISSCTCSYSFQISRTFRNEYQILCQLPPHENIIHMWAFFYDRPGQEVIKHFKKADGNVRALGLFILMDEHPMSMAEQLATLAGSRGPLVSTDGS